MVWFGQFDVQNSSTATEPKTKKFENLKPNQNQRKLLET